MGLAGGAFEGLSGVGLAVGAVEGLSVGLAVGFFVGLAVGFFVGLVLGLRVVGSEGANDMDGTSEG